MNWDIADISELIAAIALLSDVILDDKKSCSVSNDDGIIEVGSEAATKNITNKSIKLCHFTSIL